MDNNVDRFVKNIKLAKLVMRMVKQTDPVIKPELNPTFPIGYRYSVAEDYLGKEARNELEKLADEGLLEREFFSKELGCPIDGSINLTVKRHCPNCNSTNFSRQELFEHSACGYIGPESEFMDGKCPKCGKELGQLGVNYVKHGQQFVCQNCGTFFQKPIDKVYCAKDSNQFLIEDAREIELYSYKVTRRLQEAIIKAVDQQRYISDKLTELGFKTDSPATLKGRSGITHDFFMTATTGAGFLKNTIIIELFGDTEVSKNDIFNIYAKAIDVGAYGALIAAIPKMNDEAKAVADSYKIAYVEAEDLPTASEKLVIKFAELIETPEERVLEIIGALGTKSESGS